jgi:WD40 repeat protein
MDVRHTARAAILIFLTLPSALLAAEPKPQLDLHGDLLPPGAIARYGTTRWRHPCEIRCGRYSPDGKILATSGSDDRVRLWNADTGQLLRVLPAVCTNSRQLAFSPDSMWLATPDRCGGVVVWDVRTGKERLAWPAPLDAAPKYLAFSRDGKLLLVGELFGDGDGRLTLRDAATGEERRRVEVTRLWRFADVLLLDADHLIGLYPSQDRIRCWDFLHDVELAPLVGHQREISRAVFAHDGRTVASLSRGGELRFWDFATGKTTCILKVPDGDFSDLVFAPRGDRVLWSNEEKVRVASAVKKTDRQVFDAACGLAISPDGTTVVTARKEERAPRFWDIATGKELADPRPGHHAQIRSLTFLANGEMASGSDDGTLSWWDAETGKERGTMRSPDGISALSPDGQFLAQAERGKAVLIKRDGGEILHTWNGLAGKPVLLFSRDSRHLIVAEVHSRNHPSRIEVHTVSTGQVVQVFHEPSVKEPCCYFTPDGSGLVVSGDTVRLWDLRSGKLRREWLDARDRLPLACSPDGKQIARADHGVSVHDTTSGERLATFHGQRNLMTAVAYSPDGKLIATGCADGSIVLRETALWRERLRWTAHEGDVTALAFASDGKRLATGCTDGTALLWDLDRIQWSIEDARQRSPDLSGLWDALAGHDPIPARDALRVFLSKPEVALPFLAERLHDFEEGRRMESDRPLSVPPATLRALRVLDLLEWEGSPAARNLLTRMSRGKGEVATRAVAALERMQHRDQEPLEPGSTPRDGVPRDLHGDPLPPRAIARLGSVRLTAANTLFALASSPDGRRLYSAGHDGVRTWQLPSGKPLGLVREARAISLAVSPDGKTLAVGTSDDNQGRISLLCMENGEELKTFEAHPGSVASLAFSPDGHRLASYWDDVGIWDVRTGTVLRRLESIVRPRWAPDGRWLAVAKKKSKALDLIDASTGDCLLNLHIGQEAHALAISPNGRLLVTSSNFAPLQFWEIPTGRLIEEVPLRCADLVFSPDGRWLALLDSSTIILWDVVRGIVHQTLHHDFSVIHPCIFTPDSRMLVSAAEGVIRIWDVVTGREVGPAGRPGPSLESVSASRDGRWLMTRHGYRWRLWECETMREVCTFAGGAPGSLTPGDRFVISRSQDNQRPIRETIEEHITLPRHLGYHTVAANGRVMATTGGEIWDLAPCSLRRTVLFPSGIYALGLGLSDDARFLAFFARNGGLYLCDVERGKATVALRPGDEDSRNWLGWPEFARPLVFSPDGKYLAACHHGVTLWDTATGRQVLTLGDKARPLAFSPDGRFVALGDDTGKVELRELCSLRTLWKWQAHPAAIRDLTFTASGRRLVTASADQTTLVWDLFRLDAAEQRPLETAAEVEEVWKDLAAEGEQAWHAWRVLLASGDRSVALLAEHLEPVATETRTIERLIAQLNADDFQDREVGQRQLKELGPIADPYLRRAQGESPLEARRRIHELLEDVRPFPIPANTWRPARAVAVLEQIGSKEAVRLLEKLGGGDAAAHQTREAKEALERIKKR